MVGVEPHLGGQVEGAGQSGLAGLEEELEPFVVVSADPKPAYCRIVQSFPRYIVG